MENYLETPQTIGQVLDNAIWLFREHWLSLLPLTLFYAILVISPTILLTYTPLSLAEFFISYKNYYLIANGYLMIVACSAIIYRSFSITTNKPVGNSEAFSISLRKSIYVLLAIAIIAASGAAVYWAINQYVPLRLTIKLDPAPIMGNISFNLFPALAALVPMVYLIPSFGLVLVKHLGPMRAIRQSLRLTLGQFNRTITTISVAKLIMFTACTSVIILVMLGSYVINYDTNHFLYQLVAQAITLGFTVGFVCITYSMIIIDLELRYHLKKYLK